MNSRLPLGELCASVGVAEPPEFVREHYDTHYRAGELPPALRAPLFAPGEIRRRLSACAVEESDIAELEAFAKHIEGDEQLLCFTCLLRDAIGAQQDRWGVGLWRAVKPSCLGKRSAWYMFLVLLSAVPLHEERMRRRGIPGAMTESVLGEAVRRSAEDFRHTGSWALRDMVWQMNFFTGHIFLLDRLLFILERCCAGLVMFRDCAGNVCALSNGRRRFDRFGQPATEPGFVSTYKETKTAYEGNRVSPMGFVYPELTVLPKPQWRPVIRNDDWLINIHMPSGEGYTPDRFRNSCELALEFFGRHFPEYGVKGFMCDSWLFDPALQLALPEEKSNIVRIQRQVFIYPQKTDDGQLIGDLFGGAARDALPQKTSLQREVKALMDKGVRFHAQGMLLPKEDLHLFGKAAYFSQGEFEQFKMRVGARVARP